MEKGDQLSPVQRTIRELKNRGQICGIVERFISFAGSHGIRKDLFGFIDVISLSPRHIIAIQCCGSDFAAHYRKITEECGDLPIEWLNSGGKIELWGWRLTKYKRGSKAVRWRPRIREISYDDFTQKYEAEKEIETA